MKELTREQMKKVMGGKIEPPPSGNGTGCYKCCWTGTTSCSDCVFSYAGAPCVSGATLTSCTGC